MAALTQTAKPADNGTATGAEVGATLSRQNAASPTYGGIWGLFQSHAAIAWNSAKPRVANDRLVFSLTPYQVDEASHYAAQ